MKYRALKYVTKVWATSAFFTPLISRPVYLALRQIINIEDGVPKADSPSPSFLYSYSYLFVIMLIGSLIPWLITLAISKSIINSSLTIAAKKIILGSISILLFMAILLLGASRQHFSGWQAGFEGLFSYTIAVILSSWFYRINPKRPFEQSNAVNLSSDDSV